jgi:hypothetical protein
VFHNRCSKCACLSTCNKFRTNEWMFMKLILGSFAKICQHIPILVDLQITIIGSSHENIHVFLCTEVTLRPCEGILIQPPDTLHDDIITKIGATHARVIDRRQLWCHWQYLRSEIMFWNKWPPIAIVVYKRALINWKSRGNNKANAPEYLLRNKPSILSVLYALL